MNENTLKKMLVRDTLISRPLCGLASRIRSLNSAIFLARRIKKRLVVLWEPYPGLNCPIRELFVLPKSMNVITVDRAAMGTLRSKILEKTDVAVNDKAIMPFALSLSLEPRLKKLARARLIFIESCMSYYPFPRFDRCFKPFPKVQRAIERVTGKFDRHTIGVHIRRTDHARSHRVSKTEHFVERMELEIQNDPKARFFLATDSPEEETRIKKNFGRRVIVHSKERRRDTVRGVQDALVDLICLSKTKKLLGSFMSSFTMVAAEMGRIPKINVGE